jgi:hypothetical protein
VAHLRDRVRDVDTAALAATDEAGDRPALHALLAEITDGLFGLSEAIEADFFVRVAPQRTLSAHVTSHPWAFA